MSERDEHQDIQRLLKVAGPRENPPEEMRARVHDRVLTAWQDMPQQSRPQQAPTKPLQWAFAASFFVVFAAALVFFNQDPEPLKWAAKFGRASGEYIVSQTPADGFIGDNVLVATQADGQLELQMTGGSTVTLDHNTRVTVLSKDSVALFEGRLYVDGGERQASDVRIVTPYSVITDIGTLFEVAVTGEQWTVGMREGEVKVEIEDQDYAAQVSDGLGDRLRFSNTDLIDRTTIATTSDNWDWTYQLREPFKLAGAPIFDYLQWSARDSGRTLKLSGIVEQLTKQQEFKATLPNQVANSDRESIATALEVTDFVLVESVDHQLVVDFSD